MSQQAIATASSSTAAGDWEEEANCKEADLSLFFVDTERGQQIVARRWCGPCPVKNECLSLAIRQDREHGVWGGMTASERRRYRRQLKRLERKNKIA